MPLVNVHCSNWLNIDKLIMPSSLQCDQIVRFIALWATFQSLWQLLFCPKTHTFLGNFCKCVKIFHFSSEINLGQLLWTFGDFFSSRCTLSHTFGSLEPFLKRYFVLLCSLIRLYNSGKIPDNLITLIVFDFYQKLQRNLNLQPLDIASDILPQRK